MGTSIKLEGLDKVKKRFINMSIKLRNPKSGMDVVAVKMFKNVIKHFGDEMAPDGKWERLKHPRPRGGTKVLQDTGRLRYSNRFFVEGNRAIVANNVIYAKIHDQGGMAGRGKKVKIPKREFLWIDDAAMMNIISYMMEYLTT